MTVELEPRHIIKRDGSIRDFDADKIVIAIAKAGKATGEITAEGAKRLTETEVMPRIRALKTETPDIEKVQDAVEHIFSSSRPKIWVTLMPERFSER